MKAFRSLRARLLIGAVVWTGLSLLVVGVVLFQLLKNHLEHERDARLLLHVNELLALVRVADGRLQASPTALSDPRFAKPFSGLYWQVDGSDGNRLRSRSLWDAQLTGGADQQPGRGVRQTTMPGPQGYQLRVVERTVSWPDSALVVRVRVASDGRDDAPLMERFAKTLLLSLGGMAVVLVLFVTLQVTIGLRPLLSVRDELARVRRGEAETLHGSFSTEIQPMVDELNALIGKYMDVINRARTHASNLSHGLKTPLAILRNEVAKAKAQGQETATEDAQLDHMERLITYHMARARLVGGSRAVGARSNPAERLHGLKGVMDRLYADKGVSVRISAPSDLSWKIDGEDFNELLGNLMDNACKWATSTVQVTVSSTPDAAVVVVDDDGPGLADDQRDQVFERGLRLDESTSGTGLGLAIARDIAQSYGGDITLAPSPLGGLRAQARLADLVG